MKPQMMTIATTVLNEDHQNGDIPTKSGKLDLLHVKEEPVDFSEIESSVPRDAPGPRHSHHRKKMMEKWMNVNDENVMARQHLSPGNLDNDDVRRPSSSPLISSSKSPSKSQSKSPCSPPLSLSHIPADPRKWTAQHVESWLDAVAAKYALAVNKTDFKMNGRGLCLMKLEGFLSRVPEKGAILYEDFRRRLRQYLTACRQRVRTTVYPPQGTMSLPGRAPSFPTGAVSIASQVPNSSLVKANVASELIRPFSAIRNKLGTDRNQSGIPGLPTALHAPQPTQGSLSFLPAAPFGPGNPSSVHGSSSLPHAQGVHQPSSRNNPCFPLPPQAGPSTRTAGHSSGLATSVNGRLLAAVSHHHTGASHLHRSLPVPGLPSSTSSTAQPCLVHSAPLYLHTAPSTRHTTLPTSTITSAPRTATTHAAPTHGASVSTSCPVNTSSQTASVHPQPYNYYGSKCYLHHSPYYQFVPIYRTMRVVGHFQPIPYGYPLNLPPAAALPTEPAESSSQSTSCSTVTSQSSSQSHALDLSTSVNKSTRSAPCEDQRVPPTNERKRIKTEPL